VADLQVGSWVSLAFVAAGFRGGHSHTTVRLCRHKERSLKFASAILIILLGCSVWTQTVTSQTSPKPEELAQKSSEAWLALTDTGEYSESWDESSHFFKSAVTKEKWIGQLKPVRGPLGKLQFRKLISATYTKDVPNAPKGEYVIIQYRAGFENFPSAIETLTPRELLHWCGICGRHRKTSFAPRCVVFFVSSVRSS
jgi:Protein of unknown function (DUF4019)